VKLRPFLTAIEVTRAVLLSLTAGAAFAAGLPAQKSLSFISCPIYRDTNQGRKSGCWLADDHESGVRYDISGGRAKPQIGREILVEGVVSDTPDACGGIVLTPLHTAVLETRCPPVMLPPENFPGRAFHLSPNSVLPPMDVERPAPQPPFASHQWLIEFNFQSDFLLYQYSELILDAAARYILASGAKRVLVTGFSATQPLQVSGRVLAEAQGLAKARAESVAEALRRLGVDPHVMRVSWHGNPEVVDADDGLAEPSKRRVIVRAEL
jgi:OmpA family